MWVTAFFWFLTDLCLFFALLYFLTYFIFHKNRKVQKSRLKSISLSLVQLQWIKWKLNCTCSFFIAKCFPHSVISLPISPPWGYLDDSFSPLSIPSKIYISIIEHMFMLPISLLSPSPIFQSSRQVCRQSIDWLIWDLFFSLQNRQVELMLFIRTLCV